MAGSGNSFLLDDLITIALLLGACIMGPVIF